MTSAPVATIGVLADVQSGDKDDGDGEGRVQRYRAAPGKLGKAVDFYRQRSLACVLSLGDIVDGRDDEASTRRDLADVTAHFRRLECSCHHVVGNHCLKHLPREYLLRELRAPASYYAVDIVAGALRLIVLDTTDLSTHGGWAEGSDKLNEALAYMEAHSDEPQVLRYNGGVGREQLRWLRDELRRAEREDVRLIVASHHALAPGAARDTHRAWNGNQVAALLVASRAVLLCLAGHDHLGAFAVWHGTPFVTLPAVLEAPPDGNAFALIRVWADRIEIDGCGTDVPSRVLPLTPSRKRAARPEDGGGRRSSARVRAR